MKNNYLDEIVKKSLEGIDVPYDAASWQQLEAQMLGDADLSNVDNSTESMFDAAIKSALLVDNIPSVPMNWDALESQINLDPDLIPESVDQPYKTALENIEVPFTPAAWDLMEAQLDLDDNMADLESYDMVDQTVYNKINNLQAPYDSNSWQILSDKLSGIGVVRQRLVYRYKAAELVLFLLLLTTAYNFLPLSKTSIVSEPIVQQSISTDTNVSGLNEANLDQNSKEITPLFADVTPKSKDEPSLSNTNAQLEETISTILEDDVLDANINETNTVLVEKEDQLNDVFKETNTTPQRYVESPFLISKSFPLVSDKRETSSSLRYKLLTDAERLEMGLAFLPVMSSLLDGSTENPIYNCITCTAPKTMRIYASMFLMGDFNYILTPYDRTFQVEAYSNSSAGYGLGSTIAFSYGKWELETGAMYTTKNYQPETLTETIGDFEAGYVDLSLKGIELNILQIPLHIRYNFDKYNKWNMYASAGASLQVAVFKNSDFDSDFAGRPSLGESTSRQSLQEIIDENSTFNEQRFSNGGWFEEGGTFIENRYFTANLGVGIERSLGSRWSVFTQTMYQHTLLSNGFGPNNDRINTVSLLFGARTQFGSKINMKR